MLIKYKQEYLFLFESLQAFQFDDDLIDGMARQPAGAQRKIISLPWVDFSLSWLATPFTGHSVRTLDLYNENMSVGARGRRLAKRRQGSLHLIRQICIVSLYVPLSSERLIEPVRLTPYSTCSACFFSRNSVFLSQQFSHNSVFQPVLVKFQTSERAIQLQGQATGHSN